MIEISKATSLSRLRRWYGIMAALESTPKRLWMPGFRLGTEAEACKTVACAAGHAAVDPYFNQEGLYAEGDGSPKFPDGGVSSTGVFAIADFFGISVLQAAYICVPRYYADYTKEEVPSRLITPADVKMHIQKIIDEVAGFSTPDASLPQDAGLPGGLGGQNHEDLH